MDEKVDVLEKFREELKKYDYAIYNDSATWIVADRDKFVRDS